MHRISIRLHNAQQGYAALKALWPRIKELLMQGLVLCIVVCPETRTTAQNRIMWSILADLAKQVQWPVDGALQTLTSEEWKDVLTAGLTKHQRVAQGIDGGWVMLGRRTSQMTVREVSDLIELAYAFGAHRNVQWSRTSLGRDIPDEVSHD